MKRPILKALLAAAVALASAFPASAQYVQTKKDADGWRLLVDNKPFEVKGVVWSCTPIGETHTYDLWAQSDDFIMRMLDADMPLLKAMGVNTIRAFSTIPPRWVEYIYTKYGIYTMINDLLGRYGTTVNGKWHAVTDYSDLYTRQVLIAQAKKTAETYRGTKGVLMYMLGNESNYGLVWSGSEIENLPTGEQNAVRAGYLYSLFEEAMAALKETDPLRPVGLINGDTQYVDLIAELCPSLDILGVNAYRGYRFYDSFYQGIADTLDRPVVLTEAGADAYNALTRQEDQFMQATYLKSQWEELYSQGYGKGKSANMLGGYVFEWVDEWWKQYQNKELDVHNVLGSWSNAGYELDYRIGVNNMNEEWFGIVAQSTLKENGIAKRMPRAAYYLMRDIWGLSLYDSTPEDVAAAFSNLDFALELQRGAEPGIRESLNERDAIRVSGISVTGGAISPIYKDTLDGLEAAGKTAKQALNFTPYAEADIGITAAPAENLTAETHLRVWTVPRLTRMEELYPIYRYGEAKYDGVGISEQNVSLYSASFRLDDPSFALNGYYHSEHGSFETTGDVFNINREAYDIIGYDTYGSLAPLAVEWVGKGLLSGLRVIGGPEIYGNAKPQIAANWWKDFPSSSVWSPSLGFGITYAEEFGAADSVAADPFNAYGPGRKASVYGEAALYPYLTAKLAFLYAGNEKVGAPYLQADGSYAAVTDLDTLGGSAELGTNVLSKAYVYGKYTYRGLVADTNPAVVRGGFFTGDSGSGNRQELEVGADVNYGYLNFKPVARARVPLAGPAGRCVAIEHDGYASPFSVQANRQAVEFEGVLTWDPEGATWFHEWNGDDREGAKFAASLTGLYTLCAGETDRGVYKDGTWHPNDYGLPEQRGLWQAGARIVTNPAPDFRAIVTAEAGHQGSTGQDPRVVDYWQAGAKLRYRTWLLDGSWIADKWLEPEWVRGFNFTWPAQWNVDASYGFETPLFAKATNRVGAKWQGWRFGEYSKDPWKAFPDGTDLDGKEYSELTLYFNIAY